MEKRPRYVEEVEALLAHHDNEDNQIQPPLDINTPDQVVDVYVEDFAEEERITLIRKKPVSIPVTREDEEYEVSNLGTQPEAAKPQPQPVTSAMIGVLLLSMFVPLLCIAVSVYFILNPYTVTVTLYTRSQQEGVTGTVQLGRVISPLTLSQSQTVPTTGHGHQDAKQATGFITFYNGQSTEVTIPAGTTLTGSSGEQIVTDQDITIPPQSQTIPPTFGQATVSAHAVNAGMAGNIPVGDINESCCAVAIKAINTSAFYGGQDERDYRTVTKTDMTNAATPLKTTLDTSMNDTLTGQLRTGEALTSQHCTQTVSADHQLGQEATFVKITVSETCSGIAYNTQELTSDVTKLLTSQAITKLGSGYSMLDTPQVDITGAAAQSTNVLLSFKAQSTWIYAISLQQQQAMKQLIAGKNTEKALQLLHSLPGIERLSLTSSGFGDNSRIPKTLSSIHLAIFYSV